jgi:hypothetical protein
MLGVAEHDLAIVLFLIGLAATFAAVAVSQSGWERWAVIGFWFLLALFFLVAGLGWPWLTDLSPELRRTITQVAQNPVSWLVVITLGLSELLLINKAAKQAKAQKPRKIATGLIIEFPPIKLPRWRLEYKTSGGGTRRHR